jgi:hypothetical protein
MALFSELLQSSAQVNGGAFLELETLQAAADAVSTAQFDVNDKRVESLVKSIVKDNNLWVAPTVAVLDDTYYLVSGRHRVAAIEHICYNYRINNAGKFIRINHENPEVFQDFERVTAEVECSVVTVTDKTALNALIVAYNGSRSMTAAEKATANVDAGRASDLTAKKLQWSSMLRDLFPVNITQQTALQFAGCLFSSKGYTPGANRATPEQLETVATAFATWYETASLQAYFPTNISREYATVWAMFVPGVMEAFNAAVPAKAEPRAKAITKAEQMIAELQAQLMARDNVLAANGLNV